MSTFTCVLCLRQLPDGERTAEHVFPEAIGGVVVLNDMCKPCNDRLGAGVDAALVNHVLMKMKRARFGLPGKTGHIPSPLVSGTLAEGPIRRVRRDPSSGDLRIETQKTVEAVGPGTDRVTVVVDRADEARVPEILQKIRERAERDGRTVGPFERRDEHIEQPTVSYSIEIDMESWIGGLMKVIYELACLEFGPKYLSDPWAEPYRTLLKLDRVTHDAVIKAGFFGNAWGPGRDAVPAQGTFSDTQLVGVLHVKNGKIGAFVRVLNSFQAVFTVSDDVRTFRVPPGGIAHLINVEARTYSRFTDGTGWPR